MFFIQTIGDISFFFILILLLLISASGFGQDTLSVKDEGTKKEKKTRRFFNSGYIDSGYEYGAIPVGLNQDFPTEFYYSQGQVSVNLLALPVNVSYYYSNMSSAGGIRNYFNVGLDAHEMRNSIERKIADRLSNVHHKKDSLLQVRQKINKRIAYQKHLLSSFPEGQDSLEINVELPESKIPKHEIKNPMDTINTDIDYQMNIDTLDSLGFENDTIMSPADSVSSAGEDKFKKVQYTKKEVEGRLSTLQGELSQIEQGLDKVNRLETIKELEDKTPYYNELLDDSPFFKIFNYFVLRLLSLTSPT